MVRAIPFGAILLILLTGARSWSEEKNDRWESAIRAFEKQDAESPPPKNAILFLGSSSIRLWKLDTWFPKRQTINRGFGGSQVIDSVRLVDRVLLPYEPRLIVFYAGDNDINAGKKPEEVRDDFKRLVARAHQKLPRARILFVAIKPSLKRWDQYETQRRANALIEEFCKTDQRLGFVDVVKPMLGEDGKPRPGLFAKDGLHLSEEGYKLWTALVEPHLD